MAIARGTKTKLKRFRKLESKIKIHLYKALILSAMEYPNIPMCIMSKTNKERFQQFQNATITQMTRNWNDNPQPTIEEIHDIYNVEPINTRMHRRAKSTWRKLRGLNPELTNRSEQEDGNEEGKDHYWWNRLSPYANSEDPIPWIISR